MANFYSKEELDAIGFKYLGGGNIFISRKTSIYGAENISIGDNVRIDDFCILSGNITIRNYVHVAAGVYLFGGTAGILLEDFTGVSSRSAVYAESDDYTGKAMTNPMIPIAFRKIKGGLVTLEKHALVGTGCTILPGVTIGEGTSVGSMSLVTKSLEPWGMYVGIPCKYIKERSQSLLTMEKQMMEQ